MPAMNEWPAGGKAAAADGPSFGEVLADAMKRGLEETERAQQTAQEKAVQLATGEIADVADVMIASERASLTLGVALAVRNKVVEAYQEIMRMQI